MKRYEKKPLGCGICPYKTNSACHLERHLRIHTGHKPYACSICSYKATDGGLLKRHMRIHSGEKPFTCHICGHKTAQSCSLKDHMAVHTGKKRYSCELCPFQCSRIGRLRDHKRQHSDHMPDGISENTNQIFSKGQKQTFSCTQDTATTDPSGSVRCPYCLLEISESFKGALLGKGLINDSTSQDSFPVIKKYLRNECENGKLPYVCSLCFTSAQTSQDLSQHVSLHILYKCLNCKLTFETPEQLNAHVRSKELIFKCDFCNFKSRTRNELRGHERMHNNNQPFKCSLCNFVSKSGVEFKQHQITHSTNDIVQCNICFAKFAKTGDLREHMISHCARGKHQPIKNWTNELKKNENSSSSSYACFYCQFKCTDKVEMEKHIQNLHVTPEKLECDLETPNETSITSQPVSIREELQKLTVYNEQPSSIDPTSSAYNWMLNDPQMCHFMAVSDRHSSTSDLSYSSQSKALYNCLKEYCSSIPWQLPFDHFLNSEYYNDFKSMNKLFRDKDPLFCHFSDALSKFRSNDNADNLAMMCEPSSSNGCGSNNFHENSLKRWQESVYRPTVHCNIVELDNESDASSGSEEAVHNNYLPLKPMNQDIIKRTETNVVKQSKIRTSANQFTTTIAHISRNTTRSEKIENKKEFVSRKTHSKRSTCDEENNLFSNENQKKRKKLSVTEITIPENCKSSPNNSEHNSEELQLYCSLQNHDKDIRKLVPSRQNVQVSPNGCLNDEQYLDNEKQLDSGETFLFKLRRFVKDSLSSNIASSSGGETTKLNEPDMKVHTIELSSDSEPSDADELHICVC